MTNPRDVNAPAQVVHVGGDKEYDVVIGDHLAAQVVEAISERAVRVAVIHPPTLRDQAVAFREQLLTSVDAPITIEIPDGEAAKTAEVAAYCWSVLGQSGFTRTDVVIGFGGGATTDLAGFVAATWLRGVPLIQIPTTVLGMVDAAVGGKTGINTAEGKNLVGCFYPPEAVFCDLQTLGSMPHAEYVTGLAEVVKCGFIADPEILDLIEEDPEAALDPHGELIAELVCRSVQVKAEVVAGDLKESVDGAPAGKRSREILNYGHTLGHAIERNEQYRWRHGAAISVGMVFAAELAALSGRIDESLLERHRSILMSLGLPTTYSAGQWAPLEDAMKIDKKTHGDLLRFIILDGVGSTTVLEGPDPTVLLAAYDNVSADN